MVEQTPPYGQIPEGSVPKEVTGPELIKSRVLRFFDGADGTIADSTPQQIGPYTVRIDHTRSARGAATEYQASSNGILLAHRKVDIDGSGAVTGESYSLYGNSLDKIELIVKEEQGKPQRTFVRLYSERQGKLRDVNIQNIQEEDRTAVLRTFAIKL